MSTHLQKVRLYADRYPTRECYPFHLDLFQKTHFIEFLSPVTFFIGENGTGKSTLLRALSIKCGIHIWESSERKRFKPNPYEKELYRAIGIEWRDGSVPGSFFASDIFRNFSQILDDWASMDPQILDYFGGKSLLTQSHGQSLISFFRARYRIKGLYFMDEPETALSPKSQMELLDLLIQMSRAGHAQFVIATHSPILLACPGSTILSFDYIPIKPVAYQETEYYQFYKDFMNHQNKYLERFGSDGQV
ncbi:AAA family ATPase [bacterium]|nr:AAA family ATPase [bacterium]RQV95072.1 MAG: AAA family ATPase [bacterium]